MLRYRTMTRSMKFAAKLLLLPTVSALHVLAIFYLYRRRHLGQPLCDSDALVFVLPTALGCAAYLGILLWMRRSAASAIPIAVGATFVSFSFGVTVAINAFGG